MRHHPPIQVTHPALFGASSRREAPHHASEVTTENRRIRTPGAIVATTDTARTLDPTRPGPPPGRRSR